MTTFYFNTGVKPHNVPNFPYEYHESKGHVIRGTLLIPFDCDAPENSTLMFLCSKPDLPESTVLSFSSHLNVDNSKYGAVGVFKVSNTSMVSEYAYFRLPKV